MRNHANPHTAGVIENADAQYEYEDTDCGSLLLYLMTYDYGDSFNYSLAP
jgi:hypothetical protein